MNSDSEWYTLCSKNNTLLENKLKDYLKITNFRKERIINNNINQRGFYNIKLKV